MMELCEVVKIYEKHIKLLHQFLESETRNRKSAEKNLDTIMAEHHFNQQQLRHYQSEHMAAIRRRRNATLLQTQDFRRSVSQPSNDPTYLEPIHSYDVVD